MHLRRCLPAVSDLVSSLSRPLLTATAGLRAQLAAAAAVLARPRPPMPRLRSIPEGGLPLDDPDDDAVSESPSLVSSRLARLMRRRWYRCRCTCGQCGHAACWLLRSACCRECSPGGEHRA